MTLNPVPLYPSAGRYVLRLHRDALPQVGYLLGRIEHVTSGESLDFATGEELLSWLVRHADSLRETPAALVPPPSSIKEEP